jgi:hypothetical protein
MVFFIYSCKKEPHTPTEIIYPPYGQDTTVTAVNTSTPQIYFDRVLEDYTDDFQGTGFPVWYSKHTFQVQYINSIDSSELKIFVSINNSNYGEVTHSGGDISSYGVGSGTLSVNLWIWGPRHITVRIKVTAWK